MKIDKDPHLTCVTGLHREDGDCKDGNNRAGKAGLTDKSFGMLYVSLWCMRSSNTHSGCLTGTHSEDENKGGKPGTTANTSGQSSGLSLFQSAASGDKSSQPALSQKQGTICTNCPVVSVLCQVFSVSLTQQLCIP